MADNTCLSCNAALEPGARFCPSCGRPAGPGGPPAPAAPTGGLLNGPCPFCGTDMPPTMVREGLTTNGWILFAVLLLFCIPLCWLPFVLDGFKKTEWKCPRCQQKRV
jgi:lipopolysaccharide-induced tumor necrosis factor-alpha factor